MASRPLTIRETFTAWWPLAASWLLMGLELPAVSAVMARLAQPTVSLAAYGGVVFPVSMIIEAPIIMLLSASTALSRDWRSYVLLRRYMMWAGAALTALHALVAFTPLYDVLVAHVLGVPEEIREPARLGLRIMLPWTWSIAYRRFQQGVLIRFGRSRDVGTGTAIRLLSNGAVLAVGYAVGSVPGIIVGTAAVATGVMCEALYIGIRVHPVLRDSLRHAPQAAERVTWNGFIRFYAPLALTSIMTLIAMPVTTAAVSRMPLPMESLAVLPVLNGLVFTLRSMGFAMNEVVIALLDRPRALRTLRRFTLLLAGAMSSLLLIVAATPLSRIWFEVVSALPVSLSNLAVHALWLAFLLPALSVFQSWYQGIIVQSGRTRGVTEAVALYLGVGGAILVAGVLAGRVVGIYVSLFSLVIGVLAQILWLSRRARPAMRHIRAHPSDAALSAGRAAGEP